MARKCKVIFLAGVPATGKSTIFRKVREQLLGAGREWRRGTARGISEGPYSMVGVFDGSTFEGTDRLPMTVIDDVIGYIAEQDRKPERTVVLIEGDRLFNEYFLSTVGATLIVVDASPERIRARHRERGDTQGDTFLRGRRTKVENIVKKYHITPLMNNEMGDIDKIAGRVVKIANRWINTE